MGAYTFSNTYDYISVEMKNVDEEKVDYLFLR